MLVSCINSVISAPTCPEDHYWDTGVEDCEHCRDICQNAQLQKTVEACQHSCPGNTLLNFKVMEINTKVDV